jgi:hypothetical protein
MRRALAAVAVPIAAVAMGCHSSSQLAEGTPGAPPAPAQSTPRLQPPSFTPQLPSPSPLQRAEEAAFAAAKTALLNWNEATNAHDLARLASLYDEQVFYYGAHLAKAAVLASKAKGFQDHDGVSPGDVRRGPSDACEFFASDTVMHLPLVAQRIAAAAEETRNGAHLQDMRPEPYGRGATRSTYGWGRGMVDEEIVAWVLHRNGEIRLTVDDAGVEVPPTARKAIKEACER